MKHWYDLSGCIMAKFIFSQVQTTIIYEVSAIDFVAISIDETITISNDSWISIHTYVIKNWVKLSFLISLQRIV